MIFGEQDYLEQKYRLKSFEKPKALL